MDLTKITTPFGLLDEVYGPGTADALKAHGGPYEIYCSNGQWSHWGPAPFAPSTTYRVKPQPPTKPSIDWSHVAPEYKWLARDADGLAFVFSDMPWAEFNAWVWDGGECEAVCVSGFLSSYTPGTCDWKDSLVERPE